MRDSRFSGKVVVITGGAQGIGKCLVQAFAIEGAKVHFCDSHVEAGKHWENVLSEGGHEVQFHVCDLGKESEVRKFSESVFTSSTEVDVLINNVGVTGFGHLFENRPFDEWNCMIGVSLSSHFLCSQLFAASLSVMKGAIVNISSTRAFMSEPDSEPYSAAKGAIISLTHSLAITLGPKHVRVNCVSPGWIDVSGWQYPPKQESLSEAAHAQHPVGRVGRPEDIAEACLFLASPISAGFITGQNLVVDGGMVRKMIYVE